MNIYRWCIELPHVATLQLSEWTQLQCIISPIKTVEQNFLLSSLSVFLLATRNYILYFYGMLIWDEYLPLMYWVASCRHPPTVRMNATSMHNFAYKNSGTKFFIIEPFGVSFGDKKLHFIFLWHVNMGWIFTADVLSCQ